MAWDACVDLGTIKVSSDPDAKFMLAVRTSASLSLPDDQEDISAAELRHLVRSGSIWVTRGAPCEFQLSIGFASPLDGGLQEDLEHVIIRALESLSAWNVLGVDLRREYNGFHRPPGSKSSYPYSVHHILQNSGLVCPSHVKCAHLSIISCNLFFGMKNAVEDKIQVEEMARSEATRITTLPPHTQQFRDFRRNPPRKARGATRDQRDIPIYDLGSNLQKDKLGSLTHAALSLLLGSRKRFDGIRCIRPRDCVTLLDIAPAVWSAHYFQEIAARVQLAPLISSALGNMLNSKSTRLRQIVQTLASDPIAELRKKTLLLILRSTPARIPNTHQPERIQSNDLPRGSFEVAMLNTQAHESSPSPEPDSADSSQNSASTHSTLSAAQVDRDAAVFMSSVMQSQSFSYENASTYHQALRAAQTRQPSMRRFNSAPDRAYFSSRDTRRRKRHSSQVQADIKLTAQAEGRRSPRVGIHSQGWARRQPQELIGPSVEPVDDTTMYSFGELMEANQGCFAPEELDDKDLTQADEHIDISSYGQYDEMYLEAERERADLLAWEHSEHDPLASEYFRDSNNHLFHPQAEQCPPQFFLSESLLPNLESARFQNDGLDVAHEPYGR